MNWKDRRRQVRSSMARWCILGLTGALFLGLVGVLTIVGRAVISGSELPSWAEPLASALAGAAVVMLTFEIVRIEHERSDQDQPIFYAYEAASFVFDRNTGDCTMDFWVLNKGARPSSLDEVIVKMPTMTWHLQKVVRVIEAEDGLRELPGDHLIESGARVKFRCTEELALDLAPRAERFKVELIAEPVYGRSEPGWAVFKTREAYMEDEVIPLTRARRSPAQDDA